MRLIKIIVRKVISSIVLFLVFVYLTAFICSVPSNYNIKYIEGKLVSTMPFHLIIKETNNKVINLTQGKVDVQGVSKPLSITISKYAYRSIWLLLGGVFLGIFLGIIKGIFDSRRGKSKGSCLKVLFTIIPISLPDILVVAILQYIAILLNQKGIKIFKVAGAGTINHMLLPIIALSILPACYIARVTAMSIENCYEKEYVKTALGKGCSRARILWNHVMRNAASIIIESLSNTTSLIICNMLIVEYMFSYPGITSFLMTSIRSYNLDKASAVVVLIGIVYFAIDLVFKLLKLLTIRQKAGEII